MNTYVTSGPLDLNKPDHRRVLVERSEFDQMCAHIVANRDEPLAICSPRQTGKTTLLFQLQHHFQSRGYGVVYLILQGLKDLSRADFYRTISTRITRQLTDLMDDETEPAPSPEHITDEATFAAYLDWLSRHTPGAHKLLLMIDEVGSVPEEAYGAFFGTLRAFFNEGRSSYRHHQKVLFVFAGTLDLHRLIQHGDGRNSPLNICESFFPEDFTEEQVRNLANNLTDCSDEHKAVIATEVHRWTGGHPYLTQKLYALIEADPADRQAAVEQLPSVIKEVMESYFIYRQDKNIGHIESELERNETYYESVFQVLQDERRQYVDQHEDLETIGIIKRAKDHQTSERYWIPRNAIYSARLKNFFHKQDPRITQAAEALDLLTEMKKTLDARSDKETKRNLWIYLGVFVVAIGVGLVALMILLGPKKLDLWLAILGIVLPLLSAVPYVYFAQTGKDLSPRAVYAQLLEAKQKKNYKKTGFSEERYERLQKESVF